MKQLILLLIPFFCLYPQITGTVIDAETSKPLQGVNITSGEIGTASNNEGRFKLNVQPEVWFSRRTRDHDTANSGTAFGGMGMWWTTDAIVKVARHPAIA